MKRSIKMIPANMKSLLSALFLCCITTLAVAQGDNQIHALAGPAGVYIYVNTPGAAGADIDVLKATDYVLVERASYDSATKRTGNYKENGKARPVQNSKELRSYYSEEEITELRTAFDAIDEDALITFFQTHRDPNAFGLYYMVLATKLATGNIYLDKSAKPGTYYSYRTTRVNKDGSSVIIGTNVIKAGEANPALPVFRPGMRHISVSDSVVLFSWRIPMDSLLRTPPAGFTAGRLIRTASGMKARVMVREGDRGNYQEVGFLLPTSNDSEHTVNIIYRHKARPEQQYNAFVIVEDEVGNKGVSSDTLMAFTVSPGNMPLLRRMDARPVPDGVRLSWPPVKPKPYIVGVKITRYSKDDVLEEVTVAPLTDTSFIDYRTDPGTTYRYLGEILFSPATNLTQIAPVQVTGAATVFSDPLPPFNLAAKHVGANILLTWDAQKQASLFGFYVYRGTSPNSMELIAGPVRNTTAFIDSARHLSGRSQYFYSVQAENYRQKMSPMSQDVVITPERKIETTLPKGLDFYFANDRLIIRFPDVREDDNAIVGYIVRGREKGAVGFRYHTGLLHQAFTTDSSSFMVGTTYQYQVAAVSMRGDTTAYSEVYEYYLPKPPVEQQNIFYVRNTTEGVMVSWPAATFDNRKAYNIYRRAADDAAYTKVATVQAAQFSYIDATASMSQVYVYCMSVIEKDGREGERGEAKSIRREPTKATTISE